MAARDDSEVVRITGGRACTNTSWVMGISPVIEARAGLGVSELMGDGSEAVTSLTFQRKGATRGTTEKSVASRMATQSPIAWTTVESIQANKVGSETRKLTPHPLGGVVVFYIRLASIQRLF